MNASLVRNRPLIPYRGVSPLAGTRGVREVSAAGDGDGIGEADGGRVLPGIETGAR